MFVLIQAGGLNKGFLSHGQAAAGPGWCRAAAPGICHRRGCGLLLALKLCIAAMVLGRRSCCWLGSWDLRSHQDYYHQNTLRQLLARGP